MNILKRPSKFSDATCRGQRAHIRLGVFASALSIWLFAFNVVAQTALPELNASLDNELSKFDLASRSLAEEYIYVTSGPGSSADSGLSDGFSQAIREALESRLGPLKDSETKLLFDRALEAMAIEAQKYSFKINTVSLLGKFNASELKAMTDFYKTDVGRSIAAKMPAYNDDFSNRYSRLMTQLLPVIIDVAKAATTDRKAK
ncbi:MAG: DUF2059 domain-containing protein [Beijerinckiaceae bacterium]|nr:DUF2059 domain-containing protein [Beijerinckiaceae bacterium]